MSSSELNVVKRESSGSCLCCESSIVSQLTLTSEFLSRRAWGGAPEWSTTSNCVKCGFSFHGRGLTEIEVNNYYLNYRDWRYYVDRNKSEPFYTRKVHLKTDESLGSKERRDALESYLRLNGVLPSDLPNEFLILDYAGGQGRLIQDLIGKKFVFDVSEEIPVANVNLISKEELNSLSFDLVVCAQMLEHASDPQAVIKDLFGLVKTNGYLYVEVPYNETWKDFAKNGHTRRAVLNFARKYRWFNIFLDAYGTFFRVHFKILPPFAYVPVREHLNYFTPKSLEALCLVTGGQLVSAGRIPKLGTVLLIQNSKKAIG